MSSSSLALKLSLLFKAEILTYVTYPEHYLWKKVTSDAQTAKSKVVPIPYERYESDLDLRVVISL